MPLWSEDQTRAARSFHLSKEAPREKEQASNPWQKWFQSLRSGFPLERGITRLDFINYGVHQGKAPRELETERTR